MAIEAVIFDIGGVLELTPATGWFECWAGELGLSEHELGARLEPIFDDGVIGRATLPEVERRIALALDLGAVELERLMSDLWDEYLGTLNDELVAYFAGLRPRYKTAILSNSFVGARERERERYGFEGLCDAVVYSHEEGVQKPEGAFYSIVCERLGVAPERAVLVDDTDACLDGALAYGMQAVKFLDNAQVIGELELLLSRSRV